MTKLERTTLIKGLYAAACTMEESALRAFMQVVKPKPRLGKCSVCSKPIQTIYPLTGRCILHRKGRHYMRELLTCLAFSLVSLTCLAGQPQTTNSIAVAWDYSSDYTNYTFLLRGTNNVSAPLPWPVLTNAVGVLTQRIYFAQLPGETWMFYVTATRPSANSPTNSVDESPPSNVLWDTLLLPVGNTTISK